ncbi:hypothetical protein [Carp edema virus]|nr:hypothetical protein [Carp edema virus]
MDFYALITHHTECPPDYTVERELEDYNIIPDVIVQSTKFDDSWLSSQLAIFSIFSPDKEFDLDFKRHATAVACWPIHKNITRVNSRISADIMASMLALGESVRLVSINLNDYDTVNIFKENGGAGKIYSRLEVAEFVNTITNRLAGNFPLVIDPTVGSAPLASPEVYNRVPPKRKRTRSDSESDY